MKSIFSLWGYVQLLFGCLPTSVLCFLTFLRKVSGFPFSEDNYLACCSSCTSCLSISSSLHHCSKSHGFLLSSGSCSRWLRCFFFPGIWLVVCIFSLKIFYNNCEVFYIFFVLFYLLDCVRCRRLVSLTSGGKRCGKNVSLLFIRLFTYLFQCVSTVYNWWHCTRWSISYSHVHPFVALVINKRCTETHLPHLSIAWTLCVFIPPFI